MTTKQTPQDMICKRQCAGLYEATLPGSHRSAEIVHMTKAEGASSNYWMARCTEDRFAYSDALATYREAKASAFALITRTW